MAIRSLKLGIFLRRRLSSISKLRESNIRLLIPTFLNIIIQI